jgi:hypothetical protein
MESFLLFGSQIEEAERGGTGDTNEGVQGVDAGIQTKNTTWKT